MSDKPYRVLSIDGGGMRGLYSARYLERIKNHLNINDLGSKFDLIVGTSTGAILGCGLAKNVDLAHIIDIYRVCGSKIFSKRLPEGFRAIFQRRRKMIESGEHELKKALKKTLGTTTFAELYAHRGIALAITAVNLSTHKSWIFKTPHNSDTNHRDDNYSLVDACMATSAAPIYRSLAALKIPGNDVEQMFVDGGLWSNNPVLVALTESLRASQNDQDIQIYSLGTCSPTTGETIQPDKRFWGLLDWKFGARAIELSMDAQSYAFEQIAKMLCQNINRNVRILRFPQPELSADHGKHLSLDATDKEACDFLESKAYEAFDETNQILNDASNADAILIKSLIKE